MTGLGIALAVVFLVTNPFLLVIVADYIEHKIMVKKYGEDIAEAIARRK